MFIRKMTIRNFRLFPPDDLFVVDTINTPDGRTAGSGLNVFVGENGSGKSALLDAFALPILEYKSANFGLENFHDTGKNVEIEVFAKEEFEVSGTMPKSAFMAKGLSFEARVRAKSSKTYLSSMVVSDMKFIGVDPAKPAATSPDLRVTVNNPFSGRRFDENDVLSLDRNRLFQVRSGNFNTTRFDRLMEDFNHQYVKKAGDQVVNLNDELDAKIKKDKVGNSFLSDAIEAFYKISGSKVHLDFIDNYEPFKSSFFAVRKGSNQQIPLSNLGSGYEMVFALIYSYYLAQQGGKQLIILIDEPELHLHPRLQEAFVEFLLDASKSAQVFLASHSALLVKQLSECNQVKIRLLGVDGKKISEMAGRVLPYVSANETNFLAFGLSTEEYHNELYEGLKSIHGPAQGYRDFDNDYFVKSKREPQDSPWKQEQNAVSLHTFIRNQIHHRGENGKADSRKLAESIQKMRAFFVE
jgi:predicted ATPase